MALTDDHLRSIEGLLERSRADTASLADFRKLFPDLSVTRCDESDITGEVPFRRYTGLDLYLVDRSDHCWRMTSDPARATGIVVVPQKVVM